MALRKTKLDQEAHDLEILLPWLAAGALSRREAGRVEEALARDPELSRQYADITEECAETIQLNESLGAPSARALLRLFAAIDAEPARVPPARITLNSRVLSFFGAVSARRQ